MSKSVTSWDQVFPQLSLNTQVCIQRNIPLSRYTSLRVGGPADYFVCATEIDVLSEIAAASQINGLPLLLLGEGSNVCVSDAGVRGMVVQNACIHSEIGQNTRADSGHNFMRLFLLTMRAELTGLEFAVGIPGSVGGALVSNAGAYRANICDLVRKVEVVESGERKIVGPEWMEFSYRDSRLRRGDGPPAVLLRVWLELKYATKSDIRAKAKDFQIQRLLKQPWQPSAGSFFKNVVSHELAELLPNLPAAMKLAGVVPAAYLSEACGCKGLQIGGAGITHRHANFLVNLGHATSANIRDVAETVKSRVFDRFGVALEEEVLYVGEWS